MFGILELTTRPPQGKMQGFLRALKGEGGAVGRSERIGGMELPVYSVGIPENAGERERAGVLSAAAETMKRDGVRRLAAPEELTDWELFEKHGIRAVDRSALYRESLWQTVEYAAAVKSIPIGELKLWIAADSPSKPLYRFVERAGQRAGRVGLFCRSEGEELARRYLSGKETGDGPADVCVLFDEKAAEVPGSGAALVILPYRAALPDAFMGSTAVNDAHYRIPDEIRAKVSDYGTQAAVLSILAAEGYIRADTVATDGLRWNGQVVL